MNVLRPGPPDSRVFCVARTSIQIYLGHRSRAMQCTATDDDQKSWLNARPSGRVQCSLQRSRNLWAVGRMTMAADGENKEMQELQHHPRRTITNLTGGGQCTLQHTNTKAKTPHLFHGWRTFIRPCLPFS